MKTIVTIRDELETAFLYSDLYNSIESFLQFYDVKIINRANGSYEECNTDNLNVLVSKYAYFDEYENNCIDLLLEESFII